MFKKLKRKFILTNVFTSTAILLVTFSSIYIIAANSAKHRIQTQKPFEMSGDVYGDRSLPDSFTNSVREQLDERIEQENRDFLQGLLISLIVSGVAMEIVIFLASLYLAEESIKPVREAYNAQKTFVANASHEIKTPLAVIQANLEAADIHNNHWIDNAAKKVEDLANLNNQLLTLARMDSIEYKSTLTEENLTELVYETTDYYTPQITAKKIALVIKPTRTKVILQKLNKPDFVQLLNILIDNALKYGKSKINLQVSSNTVSVTNDGATIPADKLAHIYDRFYQTDKSSAGVGLGLAIASQIAERNHWKLSAKSQNHRTTFTIEL